MNDYLKAGVDVEIGNKISNIAKSFGKTTKNPDGLRGDFAALYNLKEQGLRNSNIVTCTDGVGTKVKIAQKMNSHFNIGQDLVAMCTNDLLCHGANPLMFLDYISMGKLDERTCTEILAGITTACNEVGCWLAGGETAEMPGLYKRETEYDLAGFAVGMVTDENYLPKEQKEGDVLIGISSSGLHANGFSLVRQIIKENKIDLFSRTEVPGTGSDKNLGEQLLTPTVLYHYVHKRIASGFIKGIAHITGGGIQHNLSRILQDGMTAKIDSESWMVPPIFEWLRVKGQLSKDDLFKTFNMGLGLIMIVSERESDVILNELNETRPTYKIGYLHANYTNVEIL